MIILFSLLTLFYIALPHVYTWIGWNYAITLLTFFFLFMNFTMSTLFMIVYWMIPKNIIDMCFRTITVLFRSLHSEIITKLESNLRETFKITIHYPIPKKSIRIWHPHGISAVAVGIHNGFRITDDRLTPSKGILHSAVGYIPLLEDLMRQIHCVPSHYGTIKETLKTNSITIGLGGTDEMGRIKHKKLELVIRKRRGIFKIALETGTPIVPVLTYGENEIFPESDSELLRCYNNFLYNNFKVRVPFPSFKSVCNWVNILSRPLEPVLSHTGRPIIVKKIEHPTEKQIDKLRDKYIQRVEELFNQTNNGEFSLEIV